MEPPLETPVETTRWDDNYRRLCSSYISGRPPSDIRSLLLMSDYPHDSVWFTKCFNALCAVEPEYVEHLISTLKADSVEGDFVDFGIFQGAWINQFHEMTERAGFHRVV